MMKCFKQVVLLLLFGLYTYSVYGVTIHTDDIGLKILQWVVFGGVGLSLIIGTSIAIWDNED